MVSLNALFSLGLKSETVNLILRKNFRLLTLKNSIMVFCTVFMKYFTVNCSEKSKVMENTDWVTLLTQNKRFLFLYLFFFLINSMCIYSYGGNQTRIKRLPLVWDLCVFIKSIKFLKALGVSHSTLTSPPLLLNSAYSPNYLRFSQQKVHPTLLRFTSFSFRYKVC